MNKKENSKLSSRRKFIGMAGAGIATMSIAPRIAFGATKHDMITGFDKVPEIQDTPKVWVPVSDRKIRVGLVGYGYSRFSAAFGFQDHPNVEVVAVSDIIPERCAALAKATRCNKTYPSLEELVKDKSIEAVMISTDPPGHAKHCIDALRHGKHVAVNVPAVYGSLEDADKLFEEVKKSGLKYMMFETSCYYEDLYAMRQIYKAGGFGKVVYSEGEYWHYSEKPLPSYNGWREGGPPQWYCTHSDAYYIGVTDGSFTEVSCMGMPSIKEIHQPGKNRYNNPFSTEISLYRTIEGGMSRMARSGDTPGHDRVVGRIRGLKGSFYEKYEGLEKNLPDLTRPPLPPGVEAGGHSGSHGRLTDEFVSSILQDRKPLVDIATALNMTVGGIVAHQSALKDGELMKIPQYKL
ncbi:MAG: oxidoreductase [Bacteroidetes bacterium GWE2_41_25]|nr:MAG: oxidoreductase [Bacteroidetes bacterium GWA2_40_15]OFX99839.1 MAG: oxidoreductase [Bacteroidetes bacterium GWE2_41_25]HAM10037.1 gfo/Idh/MocA family oxidoreductase [Bacteroidales bacterium]HBH82561.1 gfo/Idh/MocA family oxidoreductase [Bacteroidales bacterium]HBQ84143.1 gfo/Idh/MocA family oxidoreductase [Bacteroidales bacterium]